MPRSIHICCCCLLGAVAPATWVDFRRVLGGLVSSGIASKVEKKGHVSSGKTVRDKRVPLSKVKQDELARRTCADADEAESTSTRGS
jgi:hypothetical protein